MVCVKLKWLGVASAIVPLPARDVPVSKKELAVQIAFLVTLGDATTV